MARNRLAVGVLVKHEARGVVGEVVECHSDGGISIDFPDEKGRYLGPSVAARMRVVPEKGLEAFLWLDPGQVRFWVLNAPLKLLAVTLLDIGDATKAGELRERLEQTVLAGGSKWEQWWDSVRSAARDSAHFQFGKNNSISLTMGLSVDNLPAEPLSKKHKPASKPKTKSPTVKDWRMWLDGKVDGPAPGRWPTKKVAQVFSRSNEKISLKALLRTIEGGRALLEAGDGSPQAAAGWLEALSRASIRWRQVVATRRITVPPKASRNTVAVEASPEASELAALLMELCNAAGYSKESIGWLLMAAEADVASEEWHSVFTAEMRNSTMQSRDIGRAFVMSLEGRTGPRQQMAVAEEFALACLRSDGSPEAGLQLDNLLNVFVPRQRTRLLDSLTLRAASGDAPKAAVADYVANSRHGANSGDGDIRFRSLLLASLLLSNGEGLAVDLASVALADALESPDGNDATSRGILRELRARDEMWREAIKQEVLAPVRELEAELESHRHEEERLTQQIRTFRAHMASEREESRLEVRYGMLLAIGELLDRAYRPGKNDADRLQNIIDGLVVALREGGAEPLGTAGEVTPYDPRYHHSAVGLSRDTIVQVWVPGVIVRGGQFGDKVVLKANVTTCEKVAERPEVTA